MKHYATKHPKVLVIQYPSGQFAVGYGPYTTDPVEARRFWVLEDAEQHARIYGGTVTETEELVPNPEEPLFLRDDKDDPIDPIASFMFGRD